MEPGREGGMWLGLSTKKSNSFKLRIGVLLNIAAGQTTNAKCKDRGSIVRNYLNGDLTADDYIKFLSSNGPYKPHHFVAAELRLSFFSTKIKSKKFLLYLLFVAIIINQSLIAVIHQQNYINFLEVIAWDLATVL